MKLLIDIILFVMITYDVDAIQRRQICSISTLMPYGEDHVPKYLLLIYMNESCTDHSQTIQSYNGTTRPWYYVSCCSDFIQNLDSFVSCTFSHLCGIDDGFKLRAIIENCNDKNMFLGNYSPIPRGKPSLCNLRTTSFRYSCCDRVRRTWQIVYMTDTLAKRTVYVAICKYDGGCKNLTLTNIDTGLHYAISTSDENNVDHMDHVRIRYGNRTIENAFKLNITFQGDKLETYNGNFDPDQTTPTATVHFNIRFCWQMEQDSEYFGDDENPCKNCNCRGPCHPHTGKCNGQCNYGYTGTTCQIINANDCPADISSYKRQNISWPKTNVGDTVSKKCFIGSMYRTCKSINNWGQIHSDECESKEETSTELKTLQKSKIRNTDELGSVIASLKKYTKAAMKDVRVAKEVLDVISTAMDVDDNVFQSTKDDYGTKLFSILNDYASQVDVRCGKAGITLRTENVNVVVEAVKETQEPITFQTSFQNRDLTTAMKGPRITIDTRSMVSSPRCTRCNVLSFTTSKLFRDSLNSSIYGVVSVSVPSMSSNQPTLHYIIPRRHNDNRIVTCVYWDITTKNWSSNGMSTGVDKDGVTSCRSTHLTSFSMLLSSHEYSEKDEQILTHITYIGCGVSIAGLLPTIAIYLTFPSLYRPRTGQILLCICVSMLLLNVSFLLGSQDSEHYGNNLCFAVSVFIHYFLLTTLLWMAVEAFNMYQKIVLVFLRKGGYFMLKRSLIAWGLPAVIALATALSTMNTDRTNARYCLVSHTDALPFYLGVFTPVCLVLIVNTYVFIRVAIIVLQQKRTKPQGLHDDSGHDSMSRVSLTQIRGSMSVMIVLGVTWLLGPMAIGKAGLVFSYLFTILNSFQGFLIFLFQCVLNLEVRNAIKLYYSTGRRKLVSGTRSFVKSSKRVTAKPAYGVRSDIGEGNSYRQHELRSVDSVANDMQNYLAIKSSQFKDSTCEFQPTSRTSAHRDITGHQHDVASLRGSEGSMTKRRQYVSTNYDTSTRSSAESMAKRHRHVSEKYDTSTRSSGSLARRTDNEKHATLPQGKQPTTDIPSRGSVGGDDDECGIGETRL